MYPSGTRFVFVCFQPLGEPLGREGQGLLGVHTGQPHGVCSGKQQLTGALLRLCLVPPGFGAVQRSGCPFPYS